MVEASAIGASGLDGEVAALHGLRARAMPRTTHERVPFTTLCRQTDEEHDVLLLVPTALMLSLRGPRPRTACPRGRPPSPARQPATTARPARPAAAAPARSD